MSDMENQKKDKALGLLALLIVYLLALALGVGVFLLLNGHVHFLVNILLADIAATVLVWLGGVIFKTASVYDPYWSVQTFFIYLGLLIYFSSWNAYTILALCCIGIYMIRLTGNFIHGFHSLSYVDWRYSMLKEKTGKAFQFVNLFGICMMPTLVVYAASLPIFVYASLSSYSALDIIGNALLLGAVGLELVSDMQMKMFIKNRKSKEEVISVGLWKYSRHPNYLGEIAVWFALYLILLIGHAEYWYFFFGAVINLALFLFISIPMEEKHMLEYKPALKAYIETTSMLLILPKKKRNGK